jgi:hypothetical protein
MHHWYSGRELALERAVVPDLFVENEKWLPVLTNQETVLEFFHHFAAIAGFEVVVPASLDRLRDEVFVYDQDLGHVTFPLFCELP